eukprot:TRINITY_DN3319_c0_g1_i1.p1 TRINITY_DN3319_c0_g1~~TRINITY_DN3319_c0_g1_i1.p1  ORF type:complete len:1289 (+),score=365.99 TRINITY_DN3319_c0_g1_i1:132-3998(+)
MKVRLLVHDTDKVWHFVQEQIAVHGRGQPHVHTITVPPANRTYQILWLDFAYEVLPAGGTFVLSGQLHKNPLLHIRVVNAETADPKSKRGELLEWAGELGGDEHVIVIIHPALMVPSQMTKDTRHVWGMTKKNPVEKALQKVKDLAGKLGERPLKVLALQGGDAIDLLRLVREGVLTTFDRRLRTLLDATQQHEEALVKGAAGAIGPYVAAADDCGMHLRQFALAEESHRVYEGLVKRLNELTPRQVTGYFGAGGITAGFTPTFDEARGFMRFTSTGYEDFVADLRRAAPVPELSVRLLCMIRMVKAFMQQEGKKGAKALAAQFDSVWLAGLLNVMRARGVGDAAVNMTALCLRLSFASVLGQWAKEWDRHQQRSKQRALQADSSVASSSGRSDGRVNAAPAVPQSVTLAGPSYADVLYRVRETFVALGQAHGFTLPKSVRSVACATTRPASDPCLSLEMYLRTAGDAEAPFGFKGLKSQADFEACYIAFTMHCFGHSFRVQRGNICKRLEWEVVPCLVSRGYTALAMNMLVHQVDFYLMQSWTALCCAALAALRTVVDGVLAGPALPRRERVAYTRLSVQAALLILGLRNGDDGGALWDELVARVTEADAPGDDEASDGAVSPLGAVSYYDPSLNEQFLPEQGPSLLPTSPRRGVGGFDSCAALPEPSVSTPQSPKHDHDKDASDHHPPPPRGEPEPSTPPSTCAPAFPLAPFVAIRSVRFLTGAQGAVYDCSTGVEVPAVPSFAPTAAEEGRVVGMEVAFRAAVPRPEVEVTFAATLRRASDGAAVPFAAAATRGGEAGEYYALAAAEVDEGEYGLEEASVSVGGVVMAFHRAGPPPALPPPGLVPLPAADSDDADDLLRGVRLEFARRHSLALSLTQDTKCSGWCPDHAFSLTARRYVGVVSYADDAADGPPPSLSAPCGRFPAPDGAAAWLLISAILAPFDARDGSACVVDAADAAAADTADPSAESLSEGMSLSLMGRSDAGAVYAVAITAPEPRTWEFAVSLPASAAAGAVSATLLYQQEQLDKPPPLLSRKAAVDVHFAAPFKASSAVTCEGGAARVQLVLENLLETDVDVLSVTPDTHGAYRPRPRRTPPAVVLHPQTSVARMFVLAIASDDNAAEEEGAATQHCSVAFDVAYRLPGGESHVNVFRTPAVDWAPPPRSEATAAISHPAGAAALRLLTPHRMDVEITVLPAAFPDDTEQAYWADVSYDAQHWFLLGHARRRVAVSRASPSCRYAVHAIPLHSGSLPAPTVTLVTQAAPPRPVGLDVQQPQTRLLVTGGSVA